MAAIVCNQIICTSNKFVSGEVLILPPKADQRPVENEPILHLPNLYTDGEMGKRYMKVAMKRQCQ